MYDLWTLNYRLELGQRIATDIETYEDAQDQAELEAAERECDILIRDTTSGESYTVHWWE